MGAAFNIALPKVVLPEPDSPTKPKKLPFVIFRVTFSTARTTGLGPNSLPPLIG